MKSRTMLYFNVKKGLLHLITFLLETPRLISALPNRIENYYKARFKPDTSYKELTEFKLFDKVPDPFWDFEATLPGNKSFMPFNNSFFHISKEHIENANNLRSRKLSILSSIKYDISATNGFPKLNESSNWNMFPNDYIPIEWHKDFSSGYEWSNSIHFTKIRVAPIKGAEIKVPRELSRFQYTTSFLGFGENDGAKEAIFQILDWIKSNPFQKGVNWACNMDVALRAINWIWTLRIFENKLSSYKPQLVIIKNSIYNHGRHIESNLEYYKVNTGNHYLSNIAGLIYIGSCFPEFPESDRWLLFGIQELVSEMDREVLNDGFAHEGSTHYHRLVAELFLTSAALIERLTLERRKKLMNVNTSLHVYKPALRNSSKKIINPSKETNILPDYFYIKLFKMGKIIESLIKPNGLIPQIGDNDSARVHKLVLGNSFECRDHRVLYFSIYKLLNISLELPLGSIDEEVNMLVGDINLHFSDKLKSYFQSTFEKGREYLFENAGIAIAENANSFLIVSCGQNGQNNRGGHNHNDKLSFELSYLGDEIVVDGGCPVYTANPEIRNKFRSTLFHSTLSLSGKEQDPILSGVANLFNLKGQSYPQIKKVHPYQISGKHIGFNLPHERKFNLSVDSLQIIDKINSTKEKIISFNLAPDITIISTVIEESKFIAKLFSKNGHKIQLEVENVSQFEIIEGAFSSGYGCRIPNSLIRLYTRERIIHSKFDFCG